MEIAPLNQILFSEHGIVRGVRFYSISENGNPSSTYYNRGGVYWRCDSNGIALCEVEWDNLSGAAKKVFQAHSRDGITKLLKEQRLIGFATVT